MNWYPDHSLLILFTSFNVPISIRNVGINSGIKVKRQFKASWKSAARSKINRQTLEVASNARILSTWPLILNMIEFQDQIVHRPLSFSSHIYIYIYIYIKNLRHLTCVALDVLHKNAVP